MSADTRVGGYSKLAHNHTPLSKVLTVKSTPVTAGFGFGISTPNHVKQVAAIADGAVVGSALVDFLSENADNIDRCTALQELVGGWKSGTKTKPTSTA